jgi:hypothetical protein
MKNMSRKPPSGAPEGTEWFVDPVDRYRITRIIRDDARLPVKNEDVEDGIRTLLSRLPSNSISGPH